MPKEQIKFYRHLGARLFQARLDAKLEQKEVAVKIGKTQSYISKVESGDIKIDSYNLYLLATLYRKSVEYFFS